MSQPAKVTVPSADGWFFGWTIVGFTFTTQFFAIGTAYYAFGVLLKPLTVALDADRFLVSLGLSLQTIVMSLTSPLVGRLIADYSVRALMWVGVGVLSAGFALLSQAQTIWHLYLAFGLVVSVGMTLLGPLPNTALLANWFVRRRGTAMGLSQIGVTLSGTVIVPITTALVLAYGWRHAVAVFAVAPLLLIPLIWKFAVKRPEDMGLRPDGDAQLSPYGPATPPPWSPREALGDRRLWLLTLIVGPSFMAVAAVVLALHSHATDVGLSPLQASTIVATATLMGAIAKPAFGTMSDFFRKRPVMALALACQTLGLTLLVVTDTYPGLLAAAVLFGFGYGGMMPLWSVMIGTLFGRETFARTMGLMQPLMLPFTLAGLPFTTWVFETTGSYVSAFAALLLAFLVSGTALALLRVPEPEG